MPDEKNEIESRVWSAKVELRAGDDDELVGITGLAIPTGVRADIGYFTEEISRSAVDDAIKQDWRVLGLFNHDPSFVLGSTESGTMSLRATRKGMEYDIPELPAARSDVLESVKRGDVTGNSFSFTVAKEEWDESEELDKPHRTIKKFGRLFDVGPVAMPAYEGHTVVSARAMERGVRSEGAVVEVVAKLDGDGVVTIEPAHPDNVTARRRQLEAIEVDLDTEEDA